MRLIIEKVKDGVEVILETSSASAPVNATIGEETLQSIIRMFETAMKSKRFKISMDLD